MIAPPFPILTFDTTKLAPTWGYVFDSRWLDPYESVVSIHWKFAWMNRLAGHAVVEHVAKRDVDPYSGIAISAQEINTKYLAHALRIRLQTVRESIPDPIPGRGLQSVLRYCKRCMARGYHSVVHQFGMRCCARFIAPSLKRNVESVALPATTELTPNCWTRRFDAQIADNFFQHRGRDLPGVASYNFRSALR